MGAVLAVVLVAGIVNAATGSNRSHGTASPTLATLAPVATTTTLAPSTTLPPTTTTLPPATTTTVAPPTTTTPWPATRSAPPATVAVASTPRRTQSCPNGGYVNSIGNYVCSPYTPAGGGAPSGATAKCSDGTYSFSQHRSGTCSGHGGVAQWLQ
ncbi:MAG: DUF3761 domain-containing protein [Actinobacteria bacterium]|nr:DUF3761 domain-containing protein [Actinomycetota bacterium]